MGCHATKSTATPDETPKSKPVSNGTATKRDEEDGGSCMSREEAEAQIRSVHDLGEGHARRMVATLETNKDGRFAREDVKNLEKKIRELVDDLSEAFGKYDSNGQGKLTVEEALSLLTSRQVSQSEHVIRAILLHRSTTEDNQSSKQKEFGVNDLVEFFITLNVRKADLESRFRALDVDNSGDLDADELLTTIMNESGLTEEQARALINASDLDKNGTIDREEFMAMWTNLFG